MSTTRSALTATIITIACASQACSDGERPPPSGEEVAGPTDFGQAPQATAPEDCDPGSTRDCRLRYTDLLGQEHCPGSVQICRADGAGWLPCGERAPAETTSAADAGD